MTGTWAPRCQRRTPDRESTAHPAATSATTAQASRAGRGVSGGTQALRESTPLPQAYPVLASCACARVVRGVVDGNWLGLDPVDDDLEDAVLGN
jgi:hypothetical protein